MSKDAGRPLPNSDWVDPPVKVSIATPEKLQEVKVVYANDRTKASIAEAQMGNSSICPAKSVDAGNLKPTYSAVSYFVGGFIPFLGSSDASTSRTGSPETVDNAVQTSTSTLASASNASKVQAAPSRRAFPPLTKDPTGFLDDFDSEVQVVPFTKESSETFDTPPPKPRKRSIRTKSMVHDDTPMVESNSDISSQESETMAVMARSVSPEIRTLSMRDVRLSSAMPFKESVLEDMKEGMDGLREYVDRRKAKRLPQSKSQWDFIDHFAAKDGYKYVLILEQYYSKYEAIYDELMQNLTREQKQAMKQDNQVISELHEIAPVEAEKNFLEYDFPETVENIFSKLQVNMTGKLSALQKMHDYAVRMIRHWSRRLESKSRPVIMYDVYEVSTEIMTDVMVICFAMFAKLAEYLHKLIEGTAKKHEQYTYEHLYAIVRSFLEAICDVHGSLSEACGLIIVRIPGLTKDDVVEVMTKIFTQVNFATMSASRGIEALEPLLRVYNLHYFILRDRPTPFKKN